MMSDMKAGLCALHLAANSSAVRNFVVSGTFTALPAAPCSCQISHLNLTQIWILSGRFKSIQDALILDPQEKADLFRMMMAVMNNEKEFAVQNASFSDQIERSKAELVRNLRVRTRISRDAKTEAL